MATVDQLITDARGFAQEAYSNAGPLVNAAQTAITSLSRFEVFGGPEMPVLEEAEIDLTLPEFAMPELTFPEPPAPAEGYMSVPSVDAGEVPGITAVMPNIIEPVLPAALENFTVALPSISTDFAFPDPPAELSAITFLPPELTDRAEPTAPTLNLPTFEATPPGAAPDAPTGLRSDFEAAYAGIAPSMRSALSGELDGFMLRINPQFQNQLAALEGKLTTFLAGGTAMPAAVEDALFERGRAKVAAEGRRLVDVAYKDSADRGFTMPGGAVQSSVRRARMAALDANVRTAVEIMAKQAELEQANMQFAITTSKGMRDSALQAALSYHGNLVQLNGQAISYAGMILDAIVKAYGMAVDAFKAKLEGYKAEAAVYETRLRGAMALVEVYRAQIEALKALTDVDRSKVQLYEARLQGLQMLANVYKTRVDTIVARANLEKLKLELFGSQVQLYDAKARAKGQELQAYSAAWGGQEARLRAFGEQVRSEATRIDAFRAQVDAKRVQVQAALDFNRSITDRFVAEMGAYRDTVAGRAQVASTTIELNRAQLQTVQARLSAQETQARVRLEYFKSNALTTLELFKTQTMTLLENGKLAQSQLKAIADVALAGAKVYEGLASSALSGMNTLVSQNLTESAA